MSEILVNTPVASRAEPHHADSFDSRAPYMDEQITGAYRSSPMRPTQLDSTGR